MTTGKFGLIYNDPQLQLERFDSIEESQERFEYLVDTAVENLMFILIMEEAQK